MTEYTNKTCPVCGIHYAVDALVMTYKKGLPKSDKDRHWFCPNGHRLVHTKSEADRYRELYERERQNVAYERQRAETAERSRAATEGHLTRIKKRVAGGVCPCCNRTFQNLMDHMETQHPEYTGKANGKTWPRARVEELRRRWLAGESSRAIAADFGMSQGAVIGKANRMGLRHPSRVG